MSGRRALTVTNVRRDGVHVSLRAVDGVITAIGHDVEVQPGDEHLDAGGLALVEGMVNGHTHAAMTLLRGYGDDLPLMQWLEDCIWPAEGRLTSDDVYWGTRLAALEMIRSGTIRFWDMYWESAAVARAVTDAGLRATVSQVVLDGEEVPVGARVEHAPEALDALAEAGPRVTPSLGPHAIYTVSEPSLRKIAELSGERGVAVQIHLAETEHEVQDCVATHGVRTVEYLDQVGLLNDRTVIAHGVWLDHDELERVAASGATIVTNPVSNMKLAVGRAFPYRDAHAAGVPIGLGTDGAASNNSLDLLQDVKILALLQKHASADPSVLPAADAWTIATGRQAPRLSGTSIEVGAPADFLLVDDTAVELAPAPLEAALVYSATGAVVDTVVVDGRALMRNREIDGEREVRARALERAHALRG